MMQQINRPIFLLGPGRSGSTLLNNLITHHRDAGYFLSWSSRYPRWPILAMGSRLRSTWIEKKNRRIKYYPGPTEPYGVWRYCFPDFWQICDRPCQDERGAERLRQLIRDHLRFQGRSRFVSKLTGPPMFDFLLSIFPDARFVWVDRDPRAVTFSYSLRRKFREPPGTPPGEAVELRLRRAAERYLEFYDQLGTHDGEFLFLRYEDFVAEPVGEMQRLLRYLELADDQRLLRWVAEWPILGDANQAWERNLEPIQKDLLSRLLDRPLRDRGYLAPAGRGTESANK